MGGVGGGASEGSAAELAPSQLARPPACIAPADPDSVSDSPLLKRDFFWRREWNFTMADDVFIRYLDFRDAESLAREIQKKQPHKIDIGAVFNARPSAHATVKNFAPEERELVFDIDMDAYDGTRTCCKGAKLCNKCWTFINAAVKVLDEALREDFGFEHVLFVYSGRRGMHCWVADEAARTLDNAARTAVAEYLSAMPGNESGGGEAGATQEKGPTVAKMADSLTLPLHPALMCVRVKGCGEGGGGGWPRFDNLSNPLFHHAAAPFIPSSPSSSPRSSSKTARACWRGPRRGRACSTPSRPS